ncbi:hypothetical protein NQZ68_024951 [Dissostichus eleginoides]|nr:hypothetical protein NQZ68_024951 [Dissostichus eleginoides]
MKASRRKEDGIRHQKAERFQEETEVQTATQGLQAPFLLDLQEHLEPELALLLEQMEGRGFGLNQRQQVMTGSIETSSPSPRSHVPAEKKP